MEQKELLDLEGVAKLARRLQRKHSGFSAETVRPDLGAAFSYYWTSKLHFNPNADVGRKWRRGRHYAQRAITTSGWRYRAAFSTCYFAIYATTETTIEFFAYSMARRSGQTFCR